MVKRRKQYISSMAFQVHTIDYHYTLYKQKINQLVETNDVHGITKQLLLQPHMVLSIISSNNKQDGSVPLLYTLGQNNNIKLYELFVNSLFHFSQIVLESDNSDNSNNNDDKSISLLKKYINFECDNLICKEYFWGLNTCKMNKDSVKYEMIDSIMSSKYFHAYSELDIKERQLIFSECIKEDCFEYLSLISKFVDNKNKKLI